MRHFRVFPSFHLQQVVNYQCSVVLFWGGGQGETGGEGGGGEEGWIACCHSVRKDLGQVLKKGQQAFAMASTLSTSHLPLTEPFGADFLVYFTNEETVSQKD